VVLEAREDGMVETVREPILGRRITNAIVVTHVGDADGDGRPEFAISAVGALLERQERPTLAVFEAAGDDRYRVAAELEFRDKNTPYDNWLAAGDVDGDGRPEVAVAQAGSVVLLDSDRDDRFLPVWLVPRAAGGRVFVADLDGDGVAEIAVTERAADRPVTTIFSRSLTPAPASLEWRAVLDPLGNEIRWEAPAPGARVSDLAIYRLADAPDGEPAELGLESDLASRRILVRPGEVVGPDAYRDQALPPAPLAYALGYTVDDGEVRRRVLAGPLEAAPSPGAPRLLFLPARPNPALADVVLPVALAAPARVEISIIDVSGRVRRHVFAGPLAAGRHDLAWDGRDEDGHLLASGVYFVRVRSPLGDRSSRLILLR
jgi:hypothetical protein